MLIKIRIKIGLMITFTIFSISTLSSHENLINVPFQDKPDEWWIGILKKHKIDISHNDLKRFYSFGSNNFGYDNLLVIGNITVIRAGVWSLSKSLMFMKISEDKYFIVKSKTADLGYPNGLFTYYNGTYEEFNFDVNPLIQNDTLKNSAINKFQFRNIVLDLNKNKIIAHTKSGTINVY